jgi:hypothetical protein
MSPDQTSRPRVCSSFYEETNIMSNVILPPFTAQAIEIMSALLGQRLRGWFDTRVDLFGHDFQSLWGHCGNDDSTGAFFMQRIQAFARTLERMRMTSWLAPPLPQGEEHNHDVSTRSVIFHLGTEQEPSIIVQICFDRIEREGCATDQRLWGPWELSHERAIICLKHFQSQYESFVVLGIEALDDR